MGGGFRITSGMTRSLTHPVERVGRIRGLTILKRDYYDGDIMKKKGNTSGKIKNMGCCDREQWVRCGTFVRASDQVRVQRYRCSGCGRTTSDAKASLHYRQQYRRIDRTILDLMANDASIRRIAVDMNLDRQTVTRRINMLREHGRKET